MAGLIIILAVMLVMLAFKIIFVVGSAAIDLLLAGTKGLICIGLVICIGIVGILLVI